MISLPLLFSIFLGYSFFFRKLFKIEFSHALIFSTSIILSIYFIASILYILDPIIYASFALGIGLFLYSLFDFLKQNNIKNISDLFGVDVIIFITAMTIYFLCVKDYPSYYFWDEYSHWGLFLKEINIYHGFRLPENESAVVVQFNTYVELVAIFQYSMSKILGFKESFNIFANGFLCFIFCSVVFVEKRPFLSIVLCLMLLLFPMLNNIVSFNSIYPDTTVGCIFGAVIAIYIQSKKYNNTLLSLILIAPLLFILPNIKEVGYWFSYILIFMITVDLIINKQYKYLYAIIILLLLPVISKFIWCNYVDELCKASIYDFKCPSYKQLPFVSIINLLLINSEQLATVKLMLKSILPYIYIKEMLYIYTLTIVAIIFIWQNSREQLQNFVITLLISLVGFILYFIFRVELYLTHFVKQEAEVAACYSRYLNSYTIIFCFVIISFIKNSFYNLNVKFKNLIWFYIVTVVLSIVSLKYTINKLVNISNFSDVGPPIERQNKLKDLIQSGIKDGSEFKEHDFKLLDCFIYNYLEAPNTDKIHI